MSIDFLTFLQQHGIQRDPRGAFEENLDLPGSAPTREPVARGQAVPAERGPVSEPVALAAAPVEPAEPSPARAVAQAEPVAVAPAPRRTRPPLDPFALAEGFQNASATAAEDPEVFKAMQPRLEQLRNEAMGLHAANFKGDPLADPAGYAKHMGELDGRFGKPMPPKEVAYWSNWQAGDKAKRIAQAEEALQKGDLASLKDNIDDLLGDGITAVDIQTGKATIGGVEVPSHIIMLQGPDGKPLPPINSVEWLARRASIEARMRIAEAQQKTDEAKRKEPTTRMQEENAALEAKQKNEQLKQDPVTLARQKVVQDFYTWSGEMLKSAKGNPEALQTIKLVIAERAAQLGITLPSASPESHLWGDNPPPGTAGAGNPAPGAGAAPRGGNRQTPEAERAAQEAEQARLAALPLSERQQAAKAKGLEAEATRKADRAILDARQSQLDGYDKNLLAIKRDQKRREATIAALDAMDKEGKWSAGQKQQGMKLMERLLDERPEVIPVQPFSEQRHYDP